MKIFLVRTLRFFLILIKPKSGLAKIAFHPFVSEAIRNMPRPLFAKIPGKVTIEVDPDDFNGRKLWLSGTNDWKVTRTVVELLEPGNILLDIGANYGSVGSVARDKVGADGHIHLFEPQPDLVLRIDKAVRAIGKRNVSLHEVALSDCDGQIDLVLESQHSGAASILSKKAVHPDQTIKVKTKRTRPYLEKLVGNTCFGVKIDVEGAELLIVPDLLTFKNLKFVVFEGNQNFEILFRLFTNEGFEIFGLQKTFFSLRSSQLANLTDAEIYHDFAAVRGVAKHKMKKLSFG